jgi:hypothetical protein
MVLPFQPPQEGTMSSPLIQTDCEFCGKEIPKGYPRFQNKEWNGHRHIQCGYPEFGPITQLRHFMRGGAQAALNRRREDIDYGAERLAETAEARAAGWEQ